MPTFSGDLIQAAREVATRLNTSVVGGLETICLTLLASTLYEALGRELAACRSPETRRILEGAITRCRRAVGFDLERGRDELTIVATFLLGNARSPAAPRPRFRVIVGGLSKAAPEPLPEP